MSGIRVCSFSELRDARPLRCEVNGRVLALVRLGEVVYAVGDVCSHEDVSLSEGVVDLDECALECWRHGSLFSLETGEALTLPAVRAIPVYEVRVNEDDVFVTLPAD